LGILSVCKPAALQEKLALEAPGGFAWWYCDLVTPAGDGAVLIGFLGLPFLPGYQAQRGIPREHPGLNVAVYRRGKPVFYLLQEYEESAIELGDGAWRMQLGASTLRLSWRGTEVCLEGELDLAIPGSRRRAKGRLSVRGPASGVAAVEGDPRHVWCPIAPSAEGRLELDDGEEPLEPLVGRAYIDANASRVALPELGMTSWRWGRVAFPERELVYYGVTGADGVEEPLVLSIPRGAPALANTAAPMRWGTPRRSVYGLDWHERGELTCPDGHAVTLHARHLVEDGPFYLRWLLEARCAATGEAGFGVSELVDVPRIERVWQTPFVRMRRHLDAGSNSMWVPLFSGARRGRAGRLLRHWLSGDSGGASAP